MSLPPYNTEEDREPSELAKALVVLCALGSWGSLGLFVFTNTLPVPVAPVCFLAATLLSLVGSAVCLFGLRRRKTASWLRWWALANYGALALIVSIPVFQSCRSKYH